MQWLVLTGGPWPAVPVSEDGSRVDFSQCTLLSLQCKQGLTCRCPFSYIPSTKGTVLEHDVPVGVCDCATPLGGQSTGTMVIIAVDSFNCCAFIGCSP